MLAAFDLSLSTGVAWGDEKDGAPRTALYLLPKGEESMDRALVQLRESVSMLVRFEKIKHVLIEASMRKVDQFHSDYSAFLLTSLAAVAREAATRAGARVDLVAVSTWRKTFIGSGNLPGDKAKSLARQRCDQLGWAYQNTDVAEACGVWFHGMALRYPKWSPGRRSAAA